MRRLIQRAALALAALCAGASVHAQQPAEPPIKPNPGEDADVQSLHPAVRLGLRVEAVRRNLAVAPLVVVATGERAYADAIGAWSLQRRFPVLLDDGSDLARENIARFVRAFEPDRVVRLDSGGGIADVRAACERATLRAWNAQDGAALTDVFERLEFTPFAVAVASADDPAWTGALALAAGRGMPTVWVDRVPGPVGERPEPEDRRRLEDQIEAGVRSLPHEWQGLGEGLDGLAVCLNAPSKVGGDDGEDKLALTDWLGRDRAKQRWAWAGLVHGSSPDAAYKAMCALFLQPRSAWLFDGYDDASFESYALAPAARQLQDKGYAAKLSAPPSSAARNWRAEAAGGLDEGLIMVNSAGQRRWFNLAGGRARADEVPMLRRPAVVHFIHSFSAQNLGDRDSIARAWLDQGAYAYVGAVDEPYLSAFVPNRLLVRRLLSHAPLAAAARREGQPPWKVNVLGDPMLTLGPDAPAFDGAVEVEDAEDLDAAAREALAAGDYGDAARALALLGRDADLADLAGALLKDKPEALDDRVARAATLALLRERRFDALAGVYERLPRDLREDPVYVNPLWNDAQHELRRTDDPALVGLMSTLVRKRNYEEDAMAVVRATARVLGRDAAADALAGFIQNAPDKGVADALAKELGSY